MPSMMPSPPARGSRPASKPQSPNVHRRTQSYTPRSSPSQPTVRRHSTSHSQRHTSSRRSPPSAPKRSASTPSRGSEHVLIPVPIRAKDAETPLYVRAPSGQSVDFLFAPPKKRGIIGRLLDSVEWGSPQENKPYRYRKSSQSSKSKPFYKRLLS